ncbi:cytoplasmic protein [Boletus coccyginus]|nr:cytoplasmic protein [Boletus coccyginus]
MAAAILIIGKEQVQRFPKMASGLVIDHMPPTDEDREDVLLSCRFGDLPDVAHFVAAFSADTLDTVHDDSANSVLHMAAANGHADVLAYLLPRVSPSLLTHRNHAGSTPLHWAAVNRHLEVLQMLVRFPAGPGVDLIDIKNDAGRSPLGEAELAGWDEGARWLVQVMNLDETKEDVEESADPSDAIQVEIQDADGQVATLTINPMSSAPDQEPS